MGAPSQTLEGELRSDLEGLSDKLGDEQLCVELYRALTGNALSKEQRPDTTLVLSWNRAADFVNELRRRERHPPLPLSRSGGEGVMSERVSDVLYQHGWHARELGLGDPQPTRSP